MNREEKINKACEIIKDRFGDKWGLTLTTIRKDIESKFKFLECGSKWDLIVEYDYEGVPVEVYEVQTIYDGHLEIEYGNE